MREMTSLEIPWCKKDNKERLWTNFLSNLIKLDKMDRFLERHKLSRLTQKVIFNMNNTASTKGTELCKLPT